MLSDHVVHLEPGQRVFADRDTVFLADGWVADRLALDVLARALTENPERRAVAAVAEPALPPGSSYRVHSERLFRKHRERTVTASGRQKRASVMVRAGTSVVAEDGLLFIEDETLDVPGAYVHHLWRNVPAENPTASTAGRPPFPRRPVVVFLLRTDPRPDIGRWLTTSVNDLVDADVEARLALPSPPAGPHLTSPCAPTEASLLALAPQAVVTGPSDLDMVESWLDQLGGRVPVLRLSRAHARFDPLAATASRPVGHLRGDVGVHTDPAELRAALVRVTSGPHFGPPPPTRVPYRTKEPRRNLLRAFRRSDPDLVVLTEDQSKASPRVEHMASFAERAGLDLRLTADPDAGLAATAPRLVLAGWRSPWSELVQKRDAAGKPTAVDVDRSFDLTRSVPWPEATAVLAATPSLVGAMRRRGQRKVLLVPTRIGTARERELVDARREVSKGGDPVLAWRSPSSLGSSWGPSSKALVRALRSLLDTYPELRLQIPTRTPAGAGVVPGDLTESPQVEISEGAPDPTEMAAWTVQIVSPAADQVDGSACLEVMEAAYLGIPTVASSCPDMAALIRSGETGILVPEADAWLPALHDVIDGETTGQMGAAAAARADMEFGPVAGTAQLRRMLGWLDAEATST